MTLMECPPVVLIRDCFSDLFDFLYLGVFVTIICTHLVIFGGLPLSRICDHLCLLFCFLFV